MHRKSSIWLLVAAALTVSAGAALGNGGQFAGPGRGVTGNDTGGIFPYTPDIATIYVRIAADHCARWHRLAHITSVHPRYGDFVSFVCIDKPWMIH
jgi:hypothetical protein